MQLYSYLLCVHLMLVALLMLALVVLLRLIVAVEVPAADACVVNGASVVSTCV